MAWASAAGARAGDNVDPKYLGLQDCPAEHGCPALVLLDETELSNESNRTRFTRHRMTKLFTQDGIEKYADVTLPAAVGGLDVRSLKGRTILPDGSSVDLKQDNVKVKYLRKGKLRYRVKSATFPGVVPGAIIEWSFDIVSEGNTFITEDTWELQDELPVLSSKYTLKQGPLQMAWSAAGLEQIPTTHTNPFKNVNYFMAADVPAIPDEPYSPSDLALRSRLYFFLPELQHGWLGVMVGKISGRAADFIDPAPGVAEKVQQLITASDSANDRVRKLYRFVQEKIGTEEQRAEQTDEAGTKEAKNAGEVLGRGFGTEYERTLLFLALAKQAGLEHGLLVISSRYNGPLNEAIPDEDRFDSYAAAIKIGQGWSFYDPAVKHCPFGMLSALKEGGVPNAVLVQPLKGAGKERQAKVQNLLITTSESVPYAIAALPFSPAAKNILQREATIVISPDGSMDVSVTEQGTGQSDLDLRDTYEGMDDAERKKSLQERLARDLPGASLTELAFEDLESFDKPAKVKYRLTVPTTASAAADRILISPSIFQSGRPNPFTAEKRRTSVEFPHTQRTIEKITIAIPQGYVAADLPAPVVVRDPPFSLTTSPSLDGTSVVFNRRLEVDAATWPAADYARLKTFFAKVQDADQQVLVLKKTAP